MIESLNWAECYNGRVNQALTNIIWFVCAFSVACGLI
jgi:hypothetical protein